MKRSRAHPRRRPGVGLRVAAQATSAAGAEATSAAWTRAALVALVVGLVPAAGYADAPLPEVCPTEAPAMVFVIDGDPWPPASRAALEAELVVEASRLELFPCRASPRPPHVLARVTRSADGLHLEVRTSSAGTTRRLERDIPGARLAVPEIETEIAFVIGELTRAALAAPPPPPAPAPPAVVLAPEPDPTLGFGARGALEVFVANGALLTGADLFTRIRPTTRSRLELALSARLGPPSTGALGRVAAIALGGRLAGAVELWSGSRWAVLVELGASAAAVQLTPTAAPGSTADPARWDAQTHAGLGLALELRAWASAPLSLRAGALVSLRGLTVRADDERLWSTSGAGIYVSVGAEGWL